MASTRYGKVSDDLELSTRSRNPQVRDVQWLPPNEDDRRGPQDLQAKALLLIRRLTLPQKVCAGVCILLMLVWALSPSSSPELPKLRSGSLNRNTQGTILEVIKDSPIFETENDGTGIKPTKSVIGEVFAGHLLEGGPSITFHNFKYILLEKGGAIQAESVKLANPSDASRFRAQTLGQEEVLAQDFDQVAIVPGTALQVVEQGPLYEMDENGVVWGAEIGEVIPGQILHAAGAPVIEDGHTTVALQTGGAIDVSLVQVAVLEHPDEENGEQHGNFGPEGHYEEPPPSEGLPHGAPGGMHGEPFEGEHEGFEGREEPGFEGHPEFEGHEGHEGHREEYEGREEPAFQGHQEEFEGHQLPEEGQEVPPHFQHPPGQWEESQDEPQHDGAKFPGHGSPDEFAENAGETEDGPFEGPGEPEGEQMVHHGEEMQEPGVAEPDPNAELVAEGGVG